MVRMTTWEDYVRVRGVNARPTPRMAHAESVPRGDPHLRRSLDVSIGALCAGKTRQDVLLESLIVRVSWAHMQPEPIVLRHRRLGRPWKPNGGHMSMLLWRIGAISPDGAFVLTSETCDAVAG